MFDLLGFWFNVSVVTVWLLIPLMLVAFTILRHMMTQILEDEDKANVIVEGLWRRNSYWDMNYFFEKISFLPTIKLHDFVLVLFSIFSILSYIPVVENMYQWDESLVGVISHFCEALASKTSWIAILIIIYCGIIYAGRKVRIATEKFNDLVNKVESK